MSSDCVGDGEISEEFFSRTAVQTVPIYTSALCDGTLTEIDLEELGFVNVTEGFAHNSIQECTSLEFHLISRSQFEQRRPIPIVSNSLRPQQGGRVKNKLFFHNKNNVVVGEILNDGVAFVPTDAILSGITLCLFAPNLTDIEPELDDLVYVDIAYR